MIKALRNYLKRFRYALGRNQCPVALQRGRQREHELMAYRLDRLLFEARHSATNDD